MIGAARQTRVLDAAGAPRPERSSPPTASVMLLDAHAHYYDCFDAAGFLDHAASNFAHAAALRGLSEPAAAYLVIAATAKVDGLARLRDLAGRGDAGPWRLTPTAEPEAVLATRGGGGPRLVLLAGRQLVTAEGLEVLAIACAAPIAEGLGLSETIGAARAAGAIVVLPWGFGKWWFARGQAVRRLLEDEPRRAAAGVGGMRGADGGGELFLGDTANRPRGGSRPELLRLGEGRGFRLLPGTDPLPLPSATRNAGRYGCSINAPFDPARPAGSLRRALADRDLRLSPFGERVSMTMFLREQAALRVRHRKGGVA